MHCTRTFPCFSHMQWIAWIINFIDMEWMQLTFPCFLHVVSSSWSSRALSRTTYGLLKSRRRWKGLVWGPTSTSVPVGVPKPCNSSLIEVSMEVRCHLALAVRERSRQYYIDRRFNEATFFDLLHPVLSFRCGVSSKDFQAVGESQNESLWVTWFVIFNFSDTDEWKTSPYFDLRRT